MAVETSPGDGGDEIDLREAARRLGVHYMTAYRYVRTGRLRGTQLGSQWRVRADDVAAFRPGRALPAADQTAPSAYQERLAAAMIAGDEPGAWMVVESALTSGATPQQVLVDTLAPAMREVGSTWAAGDITVGDEHRASAVAIRLVGRLGPLCARRGRPRGTVVVACVAGETHSLPASILATVLRGEGYLVAELGGDTPAESVVAAARQAGRRLRAVCLSVSAERNLATTAAVVQELRRGSLAAPVLVGGPAVSGADHAITLGADGWAADAIAAVAVIEDMAARRRRG